MSGEIKRTELETPELTRLLSEAQDLHNDILAAHLVGDPGLNSAYVFSINPPGQGVSITNRQTKLIYTKWSIFENHGVMCLEEETQRPSRMTDAGYAVRETTTYPLRADDFVTRIRRVGYPKDRADEWENTEEPTIVTGEPVDDKFQHLSKILEGLRNEAFPVKAPAPQRQGVAGGWVAHILSRFHRHAA